MCRSIDRHSKLHYFLFFYNFIFIFVFNTMVFPDSSVSKESACNVEDPGSIPGLGRFTGEGTGFPLQDSWASLVAQMVKNLAAMWETWV